MLGPTLKMDSQVKYGLLSRGDAHIFMRFPPASYQEVRALACCSHASAATGCCCLCLPQKIWDHAAGFVIVEEAGGCVSQGCGWWPAP